MNAPRTSTGTVWPLVVGFLITLLVVAIGAYLLVVRGDWVVLSLGLISVAITLASAAIVGTMTRLDEQADARHQSVRTLIDQSNAMLTLIGEQQLISDRAKAVAFRDKDRDAFRRAITEDLEKSDYEAALALADRMEELFGTKAEADRLRAEIIEQRDAAVRLQVDGAMTLVERHIEAEQWQAAAKEAERLRVIFPAQPRIQSLLSDIESRRNGVKRHLLEQWHSCVRSRQTDQAIVVLRKLDAYLTPVEASSIEEDARLIFKEKLNALRDTFAAAVQQHRWTEAIRVGESIIRDFPNTQMAREVRERMDDLRKRELDGVAVAG
jgi:hypothetical protein